MSRLYNVYCDESCHLEHDCINDMVIGAVWCEQEQIRKVNREICEIKEKYGVKPDAELKWTKVAPVKKALYVEMVNYFFDNQVLHFRCIVIPDKNNLDHSRFHQTHEDWYYKMYFDMLKGVFSPTDIYEIYIDIKDTHSNQKAKKLEEVSRNSIYDFSGESIKRIQPIRSEEVQIMQLVDILIGAVMYQNRVFPATHRKSETKLALIELIMQRSRYKLTKSTLLKEDKFNIFVWQAR